jgi:hypothetical protein
MDALYQREQFWAGVKPNKRAAETGGRRASQIGTMHSLQKELVPG